MSDPVSWLQIQPGWTVETADGGEVGDVKQVLGDEQAAIFNGLIVRRGALGLDELYVPAELVDSVVEGCVRLERDPPPPDKAEDEGMPKRPDA